MELIPAKNPLQEAYEQLLLRRDACRKEADRWLSAYIRQFGELITLAFQKKLDCITKKKSITYCQLRQNQGRTIDLEGLNRYLEEATAEYRVRLEQLRAEWQSCRDAKASPQHQALQVKALYRKLARLIHPDLNPAAADSPVLRELWERVTDAYHRNDLPVLEELGVLVRRALAREGVSVSLPPPDDLPRRMAALEKEIDGITGTDPYCYRFLLEDPEAVQEKEAELRQEIETYTQYEQELTGLLQTFLQNGVILPWQEN